MGPQHGVGSRRAAAAAAPKPQSASHPSLALACSAVAFGGATAWRRGLRSRRARPSLLKRAAAQPQQSFGFDGELVARFFKIAEPYFVAPPDEDSKEESRGSFGLLLGGLLLGVVSTAFFLFLATLAVVSDIPSLASLIPAPGAAGKLAELANPTYLGAAAAAATTSGIIFYTKREDVEGRWQQWGFMALLVFLLLTVTGINVVVSYVFRSIDNVLVAKNEAGFYTQMQVFVVVLVVAVPTIACYRFVRLKLARNWREFLTVNILDQYFRQRSYYALDSNAAGSIVDNPDQRISEDADSFTAETLGFLLDILGSVSNLVSFAAILWATSDQLTYALIAYALIGTFVALAVGGELIGINYEQLRLQADFRYSLVHVRDNAEAIAFYQGERREQDGVEGRLRAALQNFDKVIQWTTGLTIYQKTFFYVARLVPYFVVGGLYFAGKVDFGTFGQVSFAFSMVLSSVTLIVSRIQDISRFSAGVERLGAFTEALDAAAKEQGSPGTLDRISTVVPHDEHSDDGKISLEGLTLWTPTGRTLIDGLTLELTSPRAEQATTLPASSDAPPAGGLAMELLPSRLLVVGGSGVGKSSVLRAVAGLWNQGRGEIRRPDVRDMLFLPQKPYMPLGDLRTQLVYPSEPEPSEENDAALVDVLAKFGLGDLPTRFSDGFDTVADWTRVLSLGEQQRLAAARCLLAAPSVAVLDEATSALPVVDERNLYDCLQDKGIGYISVGHRPTLVDFHDLVLELLGDGRWRVLTPQGYREHIQAMAGVTAAPQSTPVRSATEKVAA